MLAGLSGKQERKSKAEAEARHSMLLPAEKMLPAYRQPSIRPSHLLTKAILVVAVTEQQLQGSGMPSRKGGDRRCITYRPDYSPKSEKSLAGERRSALPSGN